MAKNVKVLEPGWIVVCDLHVRGCARYRQDERKENRKGQRLTGSWRGSKAVEDIDEHAAVFRAYGVARRRIAKAGFNTLAGVFVPAERQHALELALREGQEIIDEHNGAAKCTAVEGGFMVFALGAENEAAVRTLIGRAEDYLGRLEEAINAADVKDIRRVLRQAKGLDEMFVSEQGRALSEAFDEARRMARKISKAAKEGGKGLRALSNAAENVQTARVMFAELGEIVVAPKQGPIVLPRLADLPFDDEIPDDLPF